MKKIGLVTIYQVPNYGSVLQAFATKEVLKGLGHNCAVINYKYPNEWHYQHGFTKRKKSVKDSLGMLLGLTPYYRRLKHLASFRKKYLNLTKKYASHQEIIKENFEEYDLFVVGSDQVWNTRFLKGDPFFLLFFLREGIRRISIASSFAQKTLDKDFEHLFRTQLIKFDALSVRERNGLEIIKNQLRINKNVALVLDPTLLLSKEDWLRAIPRSKFKPRKKYILWYVLSYAFQPKPYIIQVAQYFKGMLGDCDIIALEGYCKDLDNTTFQMINKEDASLSEYIDLFANAELVITSSFHGTAFAINFGKPLISVVPDNDGDDRQTSLLRNLNLTGCVANIGGKIEELNPYYDIREEQCRLGSIRSASLHWINENIK